MSNKHAKVELILMIHSHGFGLPLLSEIISWCLLVARWLSVVLSREMSASWRFQMYYFGGMPLYRDCTLLRESVVNIKDSQALVYYYVGTTLVCFYLTNGF